MVELLNILLPILYIAIIIIYARSFWRNRSEETQRIVTVKWILIIVILALHILYFFFRNIEYNHAPITTPFEILTLLSFSVTLTYIYIEFKTGISDTGFFILLIAGTFQIFSSVFIKELPEINPVLRNYLLGFHVSFALIGYSAIIISGIYGFLYLQLYKSIKYNKVGRFYKRLPSLHLLESLSYSSIVFGFVFLTLTILIGGFWLPKAIDNFSYTDPKLIVSIAIWLLYAFGFIGKKFGHMQSRTVMKLAMYGFIFTLCSVAIVNIFLKSFHKFY
jgi:HemX protein